MGVSQMELVNKFDNALSGVAGDTGATGVPRQRGQPLETGSAWRMQTCQPNDPEVHDRDQDASAPLDTQQPAPGRPVRRRGQGLRGHPARRCRSTRPSTTATRSGLTDLGAHTIKGLAKRHMLFDPDHMSVKARKASLDLVDSMKYSGVLSSHSWSTPDAYPRIYDEQGFITPYAGDSAGFVEKWKRHLTWANPKTYWGFGFGADINGLGAQGDPRPDAATNHPVTYPFTTLGGVKVDQQVSGQRAYDINKDGVSHYGLYPDWIQDLKMQAGDDIVKDMSRGPEAYLQMWERAYGVKPNACTNPASQALARRRSPPQRRAGHDHLGDAERGRPARPSARAPPSATARPAARCACSSSGAGKVTRVAARALTDAPGYPQVAFVTPIPTAGPSRCP